MLSRFYFLHLFCFCLVFSTGHSQTVSPENRSIVKKLASQAEKTFLAKDYATSINLFKKIDSLNPGIPEVECNIGICYLNSRHKAKSLPYFEKAKAKGYNKNDIFYYLGRAYHYNYKFDLAAQNFEAFKKLILIDSLSSNYKLAEINRRIEICGFAKEQVEDSLDVSIENIGPSINTEYDEYVPIISSDLKLMYFTSRRPTEFNDELYKDGKHFEDVHVSEAIDSSKWGKAKVVEYPINKADHDACIGISPDSKTLYLFRPQRDNPSAGNIYASKFENAKWSEPTKLGNNINTNRGWESSISVSGDNQRLYFSSDRPGGYGGFDIWYSDLVNNTWSEPKNLGSQINTKYNEDCPFIHLDNRTLFFSSDGHNTMGGFDVFSAVYFEKENRWTKPINIGYPINSVDDDMYFIYTSDGSKGYMSSTLREDSYGGNDIYVINRPFHSRRFLTLRGKLLNSESNMPIEDATITITDLATNKVVGVYKMSDLKGKYSIPVEKDKIYSMQIESENLLFVSENIDLHDPEAIFAERKTFSLKPIKKGNTIKLNNIFFDNNNYDLKPESVPELDKLHEFITKNSKINVQINGYTDSVGNDTYNMQLSRKRANEVRNYLTNKGIQKERIRIEGFGETKPVAPNSTEEGRSQNRFTEFEIFDIDSINLNKKEVSKFKTDPTNSDDILLEGIVAEKKQNAPLLLYATFLPNEGQELDVLSKKQLDQIVAVMKRIPKMKITVESSVDFTGKEFNNKTLYEQRASSVMNYFTEKGLAADRFTVLPFKPTLAKKSSKGNEENRKVKFSLLEF